LLALGAASALFTCVAGAARAEPGGGSFVDDEGRTREFEATYRAQFPEREPHWLRAAVEMAALVGLGTAYYWADPLANAEDWDDPTVGEKLRFEAVRFDNNLTSTNHILHPGAGAALYGFSRVNGLSPYAALGYTAASSVIWEYALEWREKASINDMIFTQFGGMALGEFFFRLGDYANRSHRGGGAGNKIARYTIGLPQYVHDAIDGRKLPTRDLPPDSLGFSSAYWHRFGLGYTLLSFENDAESSGVAHALSVSGQLVALPGHLRPGRFSLFFDEGNFTEASLYLSFHGPGLAEADARASAVLLGHYGQDMDLRRGHAGFIGIDSSMRYYDSWRLGRRDHFAIAHLPGPRGALWVRSGQWLARAGLEAHVDFAAVRPLAFPRWSERFGNDGVKTVLIKEGYSFAWGGSTRARLDVTHGAFGSGGAASLGRYRSIQGIDRHQEQVTRDVATTDDIVELDVWGGVRPTPAVELRLEANWLTRRGSMGPVEDSRWDRRVGLSLSHVF
jgi:hypothetical protein